MKTGKLLLASGALVPLLTLTLSGPVLANGTGDLYVASSGGVIEVLVDTSRVINTIPIVGPHSLAFSPDGRTLFVSGTGRDVIPVDLATLESGTPITMPGTVAAVAFPAGQIVVGAMPTRRTLGFAVVHGGPITESAQLPGAGNLLAGDPRDARVAVAEAGKSWLEIVDPVAKTLNKVTVNGAIVALAIDRDRGGVLVATKAPNTLVCVDLTSHLLTWTVTLPGVPAAVASMASTVVVSGGTSMWKVDGKTATAFATTTAAVVALTASYEGKFLHAAEAAGIEVFDEQGKRDRSIDLKGANAPLAMAAVVRGSSLYVGQGQSGATPSAGGAGSTPGAIVTPQPPATSTVLDSARDVVGYPPFQGAALVGIAILFGCWLLVRWHDRRI